MKAFLLSLGMMVATLTASAQSYDYLTFQQSDGTEQSLAVSGLKITFADGNLVATNGTSTATIALASMGKMYFATDATAIESVTSGDAISVSIHDGQLHVTAPAGTPVSVHSLDGRTAPQQGLTPGVYLVTVGQHTYKVLAQ